MRVLFTGGTGFIGRNVLPILEERFEVTAPGRSGLPLLDAPAVRAYLAKDRFDAVIHCAHPRTAEHATDPNRSAFEESLRMFLSFYAARALFGRLIYLGSGAEYDDTLEIASVREQECARSIPKDGFGLAKYLMNDMARRGGNVHNLCVFGCYGPGEPESGFISHCIRCCLRGESVTIGQDRFVDFLHVNDLGRAMVWAVGHSPEHSMYHVCSGERALLSRVAAEVCRQTENQRPVVIESPGLGREYTADNSQFVRESGIFPAVSLEEGIAMQIAYETQRWHR